jgi:CMP-N-acetylneuraminic acid synthetase
MTEYRNVVARSPYCVVLDEYEKIDIDTMMDFMFAEYLYNTDAREDR